MNSKKAPELVPPKLSLTVQYASAAQNLPTRAQLRRWVKIALRRDAVMTLRIVGDAEGRELNRKYRGKDYATNVLTFVYDDTGQPQSDGEGLSGAREAAGRQLPQSAGCAITSDLASVVDSPSRMASSSISNVSQPPLGGDVVICAPVVEREAAAQHKDLLAHYAHLAIHAALHLQGYEHENDIAAAGMEALETGLMLKLHFPDPYQTTRIANERPRK